MRIFKAIMVVLALCVLGSGDAKADTCAPGTTCITGSGSWSSGPGDPSGLPAPPSTIYSAGGESWAFSFTLPDPVTDATPFGPPGPVIGFTIPSTDISGFAYSLNGSSVSTAVSGVIFFISGSGGGFDIDFTDGQTVSLYGGVQMFGGSTFVDGVFSGTPIAMNDLDFPDGEGSGTVTIKSTAIPEPASLSLLGLGLMAAAIARRFKSKEV